MHFLLTIGVVFSLVLQMLLAPICRANSVFGDVPLLLPEVISVPTYDEYLPKSGASDSSASTTSLFGEVPNLVPYAFDSTRSNASNSTVGQNIPGGTTAATENTTNPFAIHSVETAKSMVKNMSGLRFKNILPTLSTQDIEQLLLPQTNAAAEIAQKLKVDPEVASVFMKTASISAIQNFIQGLSNTEVSSLISKLSDENVSLLLVKMPASDTLLLLNRLPATQKQRLIPLLPLSLQIQAVSALPASQKIPVGIVQNSEELRTAVNNMSTAELQVFIQLKSPKNTLQVLQVLDAAGLNKLLPNIASSTLLQAMQAMSPSDIEHILLLTSSSVTADVLFALPVNTSVQMLIQMPSQATANVLQKLEPSDFLTYCQLLQPLQCTNVIMHIPTSAVNALFTHIFGGNFGATLHTIPAYFTAIWWHSFTTAEQSTLWKSLFISQKQELLLSMYDSDLKNVLYTIKPATLESLLVRMSESTRQTLYKRLDVPTKLYILSIVHNATIRQGLLQQMNIQSSQIHTIIGQQYIRIALPSTMQNEFTQVDSSTVYNFFTVFGEQTEYYYIPLQSNSRIEVWYATEFGHW